MKKGRVKKKKKRENLKKDLAVSKYVDPKSSTFGSKVKSIIAAGYSESMAKHHPGEIVAESNFTDKDYTKIETYVSDLPQIQSLLTQVHTELKAGGTISAKSHANLIKELEMKAKMLGILKNIIEKRELVVNVTIPITKCPECGYEMDIMKREYEKG